MVFSSAFFLLAFLPVVFICNLLIKNELSNYWLLLASLFFYAWGEPICVLVMLFSIVFNWLIGLIIDKSEEQGRKLFLLLGITINLSFLFYYKYLGFFIRIINGILNRAVIPEFNLELPIGISFFTFQAISYIVDVYRKQTKASQRLVSVALYISFFPQLIAGPIVKYRDINEQIEYRTMSVEGVSDGFKRFVYGLAKKVLISNVLGQCVDTIYSYHVYSVDSVTAWIGALTYTLQIYYDFSGYSDMAIGLGKMFGFTIPENFNYPYLSKSITEFWRRWHISLGTWFKEYLYIPLGGNRKGRIRTYVNLIIVFFLTGMWHGADYSFAVWGLYHGFFTIIERMGISKFLNKSKVLSHIYVLFVVNIGWVLFRADNMFIAIHYIARMLLPWKYMNSMIDIWNYMNIKTVFIIGFALLGAGVIHRVIPSKFSDKWRGSFFETAWISLILVFSLASVVAGTYNPFIYFQF